MEPLHGIFDSHAHYDAEQFDPDRDELLASLPAQGIAAVLNAAGDLESSRKGIEMAAKFPHMHCAVGFHPHEASKAANYPDSGYLDELRELSKQPKVQAIGEIGLDYHYDFSPRGVQQRVFEEQLLLANELGLPVIVHDREAHADTFELLQKHRPQGVVHCYSGSAEMAKELVKLGLYIGFTGVVTFKNARRSLEVLQVIPPERILIETDCPYLAPVPFRGKRCDSSMLPHVIGAVAAELGMTPQAVADLTAKNARELYRIGG